jgi:hypothetical protein
MAWEKVSNYCIKQAGYFISKTGIDENTRYTLFKGNYCVAIFKTAEEAKAKYEEIK